jgi:rRNA-processing protein FCF1
MKQILLDTNFIISCIKNKIDFFEEIELRGFEIIIPDKIIYEIKNILKSKQKAHNKDLAKLALKLLEKKSYKKINFGSGYADKSIIKFAKKNPKLIIATLDKEIQEKIKNKKLIIRGKKKLEIQ